MVTGELRRQIDAVWNDFWSRGISNPLEVMEQLTYLLFVKALDEQQTLAENKANRTGEPIPAGDGILSLRENVGWGCWARLHEVR